jgi:hypothetical protein
MGCDAAEATFQDTVRNPASISDDPENWTDEQWAAFDRKVIAASKTLLTAFNTRQRGLYSPSVEAIAQLALLKPQDLDAELSALLGQS